jgi:hypothetical protein
MNYMNKIREEGRSKRGRRLAAIAVSAGALAGGVMLPAVTASAAPMPQAPTVAQAPAHKDHDHHGKQYYCWWHHKYHQYVCKWVYWDHHHNRH